MPSQLECAFCHRTEDQVALLIRGAANACICNACIAVCVDVMSKHLQQSNDAAKAVDPAAAPKEA